MSRRLSTVTLALTAVVAFLVGLLVSSGDAPSPRMPDLASRPPVPQVARSLGGAVDPLLNFADVFERVNPAVVNIDATVRGRERGRRQSSRGEAPNPPDLFSGPTDFGSPREIRDPPRRGLGSGFIIDADGSILTNHHVIDGAERIAVRLSDGRNLHARLVGSDPDTDIALIKVDDQGKLPVAPLGDSATLRTGEWVCAIGNPLGYEHSVTVGVVSFVGRKLFDRSLDNYIQTDAAISFGNSGGPLINARGEVVGINAAISSRGSNIGFAVPIDTARTILDQLRTRGRVSRGYIGVALTGVEADLQRSLGLPVGRGALVQDVTPGSPGERAGLRAYDVIVSVDGHPVGSDGELIREVSARPPGSVARLLLVRDGREQNVAVTLAERPSRVREEDRTRAASPSGSNARGGAGSGAPLGLTVRDIDSAMAQRLELPPGVRGVLIARVDPMSSAYDADVVRGAVLLEINRQRVESTSDLRRIAEAAQPGDVLALYLYLPDLDQRQFKTIRVEDGR